jgi:serine/threonine protein kinase
MYHKGESIREFYTIADELGRGAFAVVFKGICKKTGDEVAIKVFER